MRLAIKGFFIKLLPQATVLQASNLANALETLHEQDFDLLMLDINMPDEDSTPDTVRQILLKMPNLKVSMFSGNSKIEYETLFLEAGAVGFIQKDEQIKTSLEKLINRIFS